MRQQVFKILKDYTYNDVFLNLSLKQIQSKDISQITIRVYGVVQNSIYLDFLIDNSLEKGRKIDDMTRIILKMAIFEKLYLESVPDYAIKNEYIELSKKVNSKATNFISYYLNNIFDQIINIEPTFKNEAKNLSIKYSINQWIVKLLMKQYPDTYRLIIKDNLERKTTFVRVIENNLTENYTKTNFDDLLIFDGNIVKNDDFLNGKLVIQDLGSYLISVYLNVKNDDVVLDLCAAPGNKTMHISKMAKNVLANEIHPSRAKLIKQNIDKYKIKNVEVIQSDATDIEQLNTNIKGLKFDKILIDAPCSGIGVIKSKPEIKNKLKIQDVDNLIQTQQKILRVSENFLKEDGYILYSTCSLNKKENEEQIKLFLSESEFEYEIISDEVIKSYTQNENDYGYTLLPNTFNSDGFYMCLLKRI